MFDLDVSTVHVLRNDDALVVSYEHNAGRDIDLVLRFTLALDQLPLQTGRDREHRRLHRRRDPPCHLSPQRRRRARPGVLPDVSIGEFTLDQGGNPGDDTKGSFSASFVSDGTYGSGRAVSGSFHAIALDGGYGG